MVEFKLFSSSQNLKVWDVVSPKDEHSSEFSLGKVCIYEEGYSPVFEPSKLCRSCSLDMLNQIIRFMENPS